MAHVVLNRANDAKERWPRGVCQVIHQPAQFTDIQKAAPRLDQADYWAARGIAEAVMGGHIPDPCPGARWFYNPEKTDGRPGPSGARSACSIGNHVFVRERS